MVVMADEKKELLKEQAQTPTQTKRTKNTKVYIPKVDIYENKEKIFLIADMPGVDDKSADVMLEKNILTISGTVEPSRYPGYSMGYAEYDLGDYQRAFTISDEIDRDNIEAKMKNGVLRITLHKAERSKTKKIAISAE
jgi:HSP20 family molecular chaperone IbpA